MKNMKITKMVFIMLAVFTLASCEKTDPVGTRDSMVWKAEVPVQITDGVYVVSRNGTELTFSCLNYSRPWMLMASSSDRDFPHDENDYHTITADWFKAEISGNKLKVKFNANETTKERPLQLVVTVGDLFYTFKFKQFRSDVKGDCQIRYSFFGASQDLLNFYDISVEYLDANCQQQTEVIAENQWSYEPLPLSVINAPEEFKCKIVATRKKDLPKLTDDFYEIGYGISSHVRFLNAKGEEVYQAKQSQPSSFTWQADKAGMQKFLDATPEIEIEDFSLKIDKSDMIERLTQQ